MWVVIILITAIIGYYNQTDMYDKLNALPLDRNELTPIKDIKFVQIKNSNEFHYNVTVDCVMEATRENLLRSFKLKIETPHYNQIIKVPLSRSKERPDNLFYGRMIIHFAGKVKLHLMYMYEPLVTNEFNASIYSLIPSNSVVFDAVGKYDKRVFYSICICNGTIHMFSQEPINFHGKYKSLGNSEFVQLSAVTYNFKDFKQRNNISAEGEKGRLFFGTINSRKDAVANIILPISKLNAEISNNMESYVIVKSNMTDSDIEIGPEKNQNIHYVKYNKPICFRSAELYHLDQYILVGKEEKNYMTVLGDKNKIQESMIRTISDICKINNITEIKNSPQKSDEIEHIFNSKCIVVQNPLLLRNAISSKGTVFNMESGSSPKNQMIKDMKLINILWQKNSGTEKNLLEEAYLSKNKCMDVYLNDNNSKIEECKSKNQKPQ